MSHSLSIPRNNLKRLTLTKAAVFLVWLHFTTARVSMANLFTFWNKICGNDTCISLIIDTRWYYSKKTAGFYKQMVKYWIEYSIRARGNPHTTRPLINQSSCTCWEKVLVYDWDINPESFDPGPNILTTWRQYQVICNVGGNGHPQMKTTEEVGLNLTRNWTWDIKDFHFDEYKPELTESERHQDWRKWL
jgi:hypothetical protein